jgi:hypothetical protein
MALAVWKVLDSSEISHTQNLMEIDQLDQGAGAWSAVTAKRCFGDILRLSDMDNYVLSCEEFL